MHHLLDTQAIVTLAEIGGFQTLSKRVRTILEDEENELFLSVASVIEIAIKHANKRLDLNERELSTICHRMDIQTIPIQERHAKRLYTLPLQHKDPFDRLIIATALEDRMAVLSSDAQFSRYKGLRVIW